MRTLKLTIAYDGTRYAGWQVQRNHRSQPTIQGTLERALQRMLRERVSVIGSGRTDAGVHALAQVAHVRTRATVPCEWLLRSMNALLPSDIAVLRIDEVDSEFHARFHAQRKRYRYRVFTGAVVPPFIRPYVHHVRVHLHLTLMRRELAVLNGRHDFRAFARADAECRSSIRSISQVQLRRVGEELQLEVEGNGFLHTMVRSMAGTLIDIGRGRRPPGTIRRMLTSGARHLAGTTAPARGLVLVSIDYDR